MQAAGGLPNGTVTAQVCWGGIAVPRRIHSLVRDKWRVSDVWRNTARTATPTLYYQVVHRPQGLQGFCQTVGLG